MKKIIALFLALLALMMSSALADDDLGVQVIGSPIEQSKPLTLDDIQPGQKYTLDGYAKLTVIDYKQVDCYAEFNKGANTSAMHTARREYIKVFEHENGAKGEWAGAFNEAAWVDSGLNADYSWLKIDVTNLQKKTVDYMQEIKVRVVYADEYEFEGWCRQINPDTCVPVYRYDKSAPYGDIIVINHQDQLPIDMLYTGTFVVGCTLPNPVFEDNEPLRMEITLGDNVLTYHIRK